MLFHLRLEKLRQRRCFWGAENAPTTRTKHHQASKINRHFLQSCTLYRGRSHIPPNRKKDTSSSTQKVPLKGDMLLQLVPKIIFASLWILKTRVQTPINFPVSQNKNFQQGPLFWGPQKKIAEMPCKFNIQQISLGQIILTPWIHGGSLGISGDPRPPL